MPPESSIDQAPYRWTAEKLAEIALDEKAKVVRLKEDLATGAISQVQYEILADRVWNWARRRRIGAWQKAFFGEPLIMPGHYARVEVWDADETQI